MAFGQKLIVTLLGMGLLLGMGNGNLAAKADENVLTVGIDSQPKTLDPRYATDATGMQIAYNLIFSTLVEHGPDLRIVPKLAERWETPDAKTYRFYLRQDVTFHDGKPLTANDVKFTFEQLKAEKTQSPFSGTYRMIREIRVLNQHTVEFRLEQAVAFF